MELGGGETKKLGLGADCFLLNSRDYSEPKAAFYNCSSLWLLDFLLMLVTRPINGSPWSGS